MTDSVQSPFVAATEQCEPDQFAELLRACAERNAVTLLRRHLDDRGNVLELRKALCAAAMRGEERFQWSLPFDTDNWFAQFSLMDKACVDQMASALRETLFGASCDQSISVAHNACVQNTFVFSWPMAECAQAAVEAGAPEPTLLALANTSAGTAQDNVQQTARRQGDNVLRYSARNIRRPTSTAPVTVHAAAHSENETAADDSEPKCANKDNDLVFF